jgi:hypothetical protein
MGWACDTYGKTGEVQTGFWWADPPGNIGVNGRIILKWTFMKWDVGSVDRIELAQDRDRWRALVNVVMNLRVP